MAYGTTLSTDSQTNRSIEVVSTGIVQGPPHSDLSFAFRVRIHWFKAAHTRILTETCQNPDFRGLFTQSGGTVFEHRD